MKKIDFSVILANIAFKIVPTILISIYLWLMYSSTITELHTDAWANVAVFTVGILVSFFLYSYRVRFSVTFLLLAGIIFGIYKFLGSLTFGEFDAFYHSISFFIYAGVFVFAWIMGFGFARFTYFPWAASLAVFVVAVIFVVNDFFNLQTQMNAQYVSWATTTIFSDNSLGFRFVTMLFLLIVPVLFYSIYIVSINEILRKLTYVDSQKFRYLFRRTFITIAVLILILLLPLLYVYFFSIPETLQEQLTNAQANSADFLEKTGGGGAGGDPPEFDLRDYAQLLPEVKLSDETVFCTYIDNFFPAADGSKVPLPVHFRRFVLNRYEPRTEKFVLDPYPPSSVPNDLFSPSIKDVPIGFSITDSVIQSYTQEYQYRRNISSLVYNQSLAKDAYVAPNTGYFYQKMPLAPEDRETFTSAYQCSSLISIWNLPPFVYSTTNPELATFRDQRAEALNFDTDLLYSFLDSTFLNYYTEFDTTDTLILNLAKQVTEGKETPYQKIESIVDYFTGNDESGNKRFTYSLEPGSPKTSGQSFMHYFLFENKKGYCTYFAGATTLMLRALGIPCRVAVGYAIYDRSNKNSGWYWVYADQGHAWIEVYFPSFGWVDFDTTPSDDTEPVRPPKPDATPPEYAREPIFAVLGKITGMSGDSTNLMVRPYSIRYRNEMYEIPEEESEIISLKPNDGTVTIDDEKVKIGDFPLDRTMVLSSYSFNYDLEKIRDYKPKNSRRKPKTPFMEWFVKYFPEEIPVDEAIIVYKDDSENEGMIFAVDGRIESILPDSSGLTITPNKIFYRNKNYTVDQSRLGTINIKPKEGVIYLDDEQKSLKEFAVGDSMIISAESGDPMLHAIKPFLATEAFDTWFKNRFPENIPVDKVNLHLDKTAPIAQFAWGLLIAIAAGLLILILLSTALYLYFSWRIGAAKDHKKLYWLYRYSLMLLNQLGFHRVVKTPLEYAHETIDPKFGTELEQFMNIYHKAKYAPAGVGLAPSEAQFVEEFQKQFKEKIFERFSRWEVLRDFANFIRTLRFLSIK